MILDSPSFFLLDKPHSISSFKHISKFKRECGYSFQKIGHSGTLDPFATGALLVAVNRATKFLQFLPSVKEYVFDVQFGFCTDSDDLDGVLLDYSNLRPSLDDLINLLPFFIGQISQTPSRFSALQINGVRAYQLARKNISFEMPSRIVFIESLKLLYFDGEVASFRMVCSKGTYVRSVASHLASLLGVLACVVNLRRVATDGFSLDSSLSVEPIFLDFFFKLYVPLAITLENFNDLKRGKYCSLFSNDGIYSLRVEDDQNAFFAGLGSIKAGVLRGLCLI